MVAVEIIICYYLSNLCALLLVIAVELLIFMCVNKLLAGTGDPPGMIYPVGYGSRGNSAPIVGMGILAVSNFYGGYGSGEIFMTGTGLEWPYPMEIYPLPSLAVQCRRGKSPC